MHTHLPHHDRPRCLRTLSERHGDPTMTPGSMGDETGLRDDVCPGVLRRARSGGVQPENGGVDVQSNAFITHLHGAMEELSDAEQLDRLLAELDGADEDHPDVAVTTDAGWSLSAFSSGWLLWENVEADNPAARHLAKLTRREQLRFMRWLAEGDIASVDSTAWRNGC